VTEPTKAKLPPRDPAPVEGRLLFSVPQGARVLGISPRLLWELVKRGEVPTRTIGRRRLIHRRELERFANQDHSGMKGAK
jgi:excisionase family DNA binding protein